MNSAAPRLAPLHSAALRLVLLNSLALRLAHREPNPAHTIVRGTKTMTEGGEGGATKANPSPEGEIY